MLRMKNTESKAYPVQPDATFAHLYQVGAVAALLAACLFRRNLDAEWMLLRQLGVITNGPGAAPETIQGWLELLDQSPLLGLTFLNLFDLVNYVLVGLILLALVFALRKLAPSGMAVAGALSAAGVMINLASNQAFALLSLSHAYAASTGAAQRELILAAGQAALAMHHNASYSPDGISLSFLLVSTAGMIVSIVMLRGRIFSRGTAWMGMLANGFQLSYYIFWAAAPALVALPISISAVFLLIWYIQIGLRLWRLGRESSSVYAVTRGKAEPRPENAFQPQG
jgi:hypothetical protein